MDAVLSKSDIGQNIFQSILGIQFHLTASNKKKHIILFYNSCARGFPTNEQSPLNSRQPAAAYKVIEPVDVLDISEGQSEGVWTQSGWDRGQGVTALTN